MISYQPFTVSVFLFCIVSKTESDGIVENRKLLPTPRTSVRWLVRFWTRTYSAPGLPCGIRCLMIHSAFR